MIIPFGRFDLKCIIHEGLKDSFFRYIDQLFARAENLCKQKKQRNGMPCTQFVVIYDADELSMLSLASFGGKDHCIYPLSSLKPQRSFPKFKLKLFNFIVCVFSGGYGFGNRPPF